MAEMELSDREIARRAREREQRVVLEKVFPDYDPRRHDAFVMRYRDQIEAARKDQWMQRRGIIE